MEGLPVIRAHDASKKVGVGSALQGPQPVAQVFAGHFVEGEVLCSRSLALAAIFRDARIWADQSCALGSAVFTQARCNEF